MCQLLRFARLRHALQRYPVANSGGGADFLSPKKKNRCFPSVALERINRRVYTGVLRLPMFPKSARASHFVPA
jgi:hypothetical protein